MERSRLRLVYLTLTSLKKKVKYLCTFLNGDRVKKIEDKEKPRGLLKFLFKRDPLNSFPRYYIFRFKKLQFCILLLLSEKFSLIFRVVFVLVKIFGEDDTFRETE